MDIEGVIAIICVFGFVPVIVYLNQRHKERKALIESGQTDALFETKKNNTNYLNNLKYGLVAVGLALGILFGSLLDNQTELVEEAAYFSMIFLFGGLALLIFYFISLKHKNKE